MLRVVTVLILLASAGIGGVAGLVSAGSSEVELGRALLAELQAGDFNALERRIDPALKSAALRSQLAAMADLLPAEPPRAIQVASLTRTFLQTVRTGTTYRVTLELQLEFPDRWVLMLLQWRSEADNPVLETFRLQPLPASLETLNRFSFDGKSATHYLAAALVVAMPIFSVVVLWLCIRSPLTRKRRMLWALAILIGVGTAHFNWTTGAIWFDPLSASLLSSGYSRQGLLGPYVLNLSVPLGAIAFLLRHRRGANGISSAA